MRSSLEALPKGTLKNLSPMGKISTDVWWTELVISIRLTAVWLGNCGVMGKM